MNYIDDIATALHAEHPSIDLAVDAAMARGYAVLVLTTGETTEDADVHHVWAAVRLATWPEHADIVPFSQLTPERIAYDRPFRDAIRTVARRRREAGTAA